MYKHEVKTHEKNKATKAYNVEQVHYNSDDIEICLLFILWFQKTVFFKTGISNFSFYSFSPIRTFCIKNLINLLP